MDGVYNRSLFAKKATEARDKLRQMGGVQPMPQQPQAPALGISGMMQPPRGAAPMGGIMASSPELMQAAMRKPVVLPTTNQPTAAPAPAPQPQMLPPSQPIPNIAGIPQQQPQQQRAQPQAPQQQQKKPVKKMANGGDTFLDHYKTPALKKAVEKSTGKSFDEAFKFGQKAITSEDPTKLGIPEGAADKLKAFGKADKSPEEVGAAITSDMPKEEKTGSLKEDLKKTLKRAGVEEIPVEAEIDELNTAIMGATLGAAIAGSYVNPQTGQELRPTAGARIGQAVSQGLMLRRDTETRRATQEADLAKARIAARSKAKAPEKFLDSELGKTMLKFADTLAAKADYNSEQMRDNMTQAFGPEAVKAYDAAIAAQVGGVAAPSQTVETVETTETVETVFNPTARLKDGTPIMKQGNRWVDAEGNDRTNG